MVEHTAVNRGVVGSSPTRGADIFGKFIARLPNIKFCVGFAAFMVIIISFILLPV